MAVTNDHLAEMRREVERIIDEAEDTASDNVAARHGLDPTELLEAYEKTGRP